MSLLAGGSILLLSLLLIHVVVAPALHAGAHWLYRGSPPAGPDPWRSRMAFIMLGLPPILVLALGASGLAHLSEGGGAWAGLLEACHRLHGHCDLLLLSPVEASVYGAIMVAVSTWVALAGWRVLAPVAALRRVPATELAPSLVRKVANARSALGALRVRVIEGPPGLAVSAGLLRPLVLLSQDVVERLSEDELIAVLAHEAAHARSFDGLRAVAIRFASALSLPGRSCEVEASYGLDREILCDAEAVRSGVDPLTLAAALVAMARAQIAVASPATPAALGRHDHRNAIQTRVALLLQAGERGSSSEPERRSAFAAVLLLAAAVALPHAAFGAIVLVHCGVESLVHLLS